MPEMRETPASLRAVNPLPLAIPVGLGGLVAGRELSGSGILHFDGRTIRIETRDAVAGEDAERHTAGPAVVRRSGPRLQWPVASLDGVRYREGELTVFVRNGDILEITGPARLTAVAEAIEADAQALGEMTRGLRALGARRRGASSGSEQTRFFKPLLQARRAVESPKRGRSPDQLAAFDADVLRESVGAAVAELATARYAASPPHRRALEAELEECAEPLLDGISSLARAADGVRGAPDDTRLVLWRAWAAEVQQLFERADRCWCAMVPILEEAAPAPRRSWWRRVLRIGAAPRRTKG